MLKSSLCNYSDAYILVSETAMVVESASGRENDNIQAAFKIVFPFTNCISEKNNRKIDNAKDIDVVMLMYNLIECNNNIRKIMAIL